MMGELGWTAIPHHLKYQQRNIILLVSLLVFSFLLRVVPYFRYGPVLRDHDPFLNFRFTQSLQENGLASFPEFVDEQSWYPEGSKISQTTYPGPLLIASFLQRIVSFCHIPINLLSICLFLPPLSSIFSTLGVFFITKDLSDQPSALIASFFFILSPSYLSHSLVGSFDNECFGLVTFLFTLYFWIRSLQTGSLFDVLKALVSYSLLAATWEAHIFAINIFAIHTLFLLFFRSPKYLFRVYSLFYLGSSLLLTQIPVIEYRVFTSPDYFFPLLCFILIQLNQILQDKIVYSQMIVFLIGLVSICTAYFLSSSSSSSNLPFFTPSPMSDMIYSLFHPSFVRETSPLFASMTKNLPATWAAFYSEFSWLLLFIPSGLHYLSFTTAANDSTLLIPIYFFFSLFTTSIMVRWMIILAPVVSICAGISFYRLFFAHYSLFTIRPRPISRMTQDLPRTQKNTSGAIVFLLSFIFLLIFTHSLWVCSKQYPNSNFPQYRNTEGKLVDADDFREGLQWIEQNTPQDSKVLAWWDYGSQIAVMANRPVFCDSSQANQTRISEVALLFVSDEKEALQRAQKMGVDYLVVVFGGLIGVRSDDLNKMPWMIRLAKEIDGTITESDYYSTKGAFSIGEDAPSALRNSLLYKLSYHRFSEIPQEKHEFGYDKIRRTRVGEQDIPLSYFEEVYSTKSFFLRIYRVLAKDKDSGQFQ